MPARRLLAVFMIGSCLIGCGSLGESVPVESGSRELNGTSLFVKTLGDGEPIFVIHGGPVLEHGYLLPHLEPLARRYRLVLYDQRLSGRSSADVDPATIRMSEFVADLEALRRSEGLERFHLMAHSWGGVIALNYALVHGDRLRSLVLLDSMPGSFELWRQEQAEVGERMTAADREERQAILDSAAYAGKQPGAYRDLYRISFRGQFHRPELVDRLEFYIAPDLDRRSERFGGIMQDLTGYELHPRLATVDLPVLLLYGADEPGSTISGPKLKASLPNAELVVLPEAGHFPFVEQPDAFLQTVLDFLAD